MLYSREGFPVHRQLLDRRQFLALTGYGAAAVVLPPRSVWGQTEADLRPRPNILLILADDLGYGDVGVQGCADIPTPHIDSIAANGVRFTDGYATCPVCAPSRAGLMTGRYQQRFGFEHNPGPEEHTDPDFGLPLTETSLAERLKQVGYVTGLFGKWHLGFKPEFAPQQRGFNEFFGFLGGTNSYLPSPLYRKRSPILRCAEPVDESEYLTDAFARETVAFIDRHRNDPWFAYLTFNAVHTPLQATEQYLSRFAHIQDEKRRTYAAMSAAMDDAVGRVLTKVRELKLEENTLVMLLSDNGGPTRQTTSSNAPLRGYKGDVWEGGVRVPFMAQWKGRIPRGKVLHAPTSSLDILPTAVAAAGVPVSPHWKLDGVNLLPYLSGRNPGKPHNTLYWRMGDKHAVRHGDWKLVVDGAQSKPSLYNLAEDIGEKSDRAAQKPRKLKRLTDLYNAWDAQMEKPRWVRQGAETRISNLEDRFQQSDRDGDGRLSHLELPNDELFKQMDANGDGFVDLREARAYYRKRAEEAPAGDD
ncbi:MAG: sulfatase-like hydrolase/transferase [Armatimonadetes bacterium]|nr:sulfatase-like hydrolase/transferase [Armatimonadota bacterium]PIU67349.1 MAG: sulfatase [Armatimonadetes bacterium CG07_land_8_20_14_0_80_59_28]PIX44745.1 MAG: sulfatase [Armatimonadetes bacterium CG_4_8_14_3_um_filter_58_9]PIY42194.1 MAG: sulfatase [Armatimonadetes bacterium CG_4_10_14_3_um_filter_59_10]PJB77897.1 MAG: sulfatase [Armatimonadetes bacterium CG_4_9_14_3_um_filter_58_7]